MPYARAVVVQPGPGIGPPFGQDIAPTLAVVRVTRRREYLRLVERRQVRTGIQRYGRRQVDRTGNEQIPFRYGFIGTAHVIPALVIAAAISSARGIDGIAPSRCTLSDAAAIARSAAAVIDVAADETGRQDAAERVAGARGVHHLYGRRRQESTRTGTFGDPRARPRPG